MAKVVGLTVVQQKGQGKEGEWRCMGPDLGFSMAATFAALTTNLP